MNVTLEKKSLPVIFNGQLNCEAHNVSGNGTMNCMVVKDRSGIWLMGTVFSLDELEAILKAMKELA